VLDVSVELREVEEKSGLAVATLNESVRMQKFFDYARFSDPQSSALKIVRRLVENVSTGSDVGAAVAELHRRCISCRRRRCCRRHRERPDLEVSDRRERVVGPSGG